MTTPDRADVAQAAVAVRRLLIDPDFTVADVLAVLRADATTFAAWVAITLAGDLILMNALGQASGKDALRRELDRQLLELAQQERNEPR